ncbi:tRNA pseudouridine synthase [Sistotremastrum niveocremeum HHB9708]|uniref:tRNA pseudouridine synthase 1 n=1 Tax=Sistotremastrum niveocremeum HHB9708 TaxID=1314777 RepID=A0A164RQD0_9AGAM|nr:tRNA pseudouridine synthase [Sistotremastrum niveocremeum HHB9708]
MSDETPKRALDADGAASARHAKKSRTQDPTENPSDPTSSTNGKSGKRKLARNAGRRRGTRADDLPPQDGEDGEKKQRLPKRACALLIGFSGTGYFGMQSQRNAGLKTIEGTLFDALVRAGAVSEDNADDPVKVNLQRAARTDAGVHAAGNVVSIRMITAVPEVPDLVARINEELPPEIRLWGFVRTQNPFNARVSCDSRKYTYFFPSYLFIPPKPDSGFARALQETNVKLRAGAETSGVDGAADDVHPFWKDSSLDSSPEEDLARKRTWRCSSQDVERFRTAVNKYLGSHNFHNFTVGREYKDPSNRRVMKAIEVSDPVVYGNTEWISVMLHGQSFMLHQRKMVCVAVMMCRTSTPPSLIPELYGQRKVTVPKAPALGLLLEYPVFENYNRKVEDLNGKIPKDANPEQLDAIRPIIDFEQFRPQIDAFKQHYIYDNMRTHEDREGVFDGWIRSIDAYAGPDLQYFNHKGAVLPTCVIIKGEIRHSSFKEKKKFNSTTFPVASALDDEAEAGVINDDGEPDNEDEETEIDKKLLVDMEG